MYSLGRLLNVAQTGRSKGMEGMQRAILSMAPENILIFRIDVNQIIPNIGMRVSRVLQDSRGTNMAVERNAVGMLLIVAQTGICKGREGMQRTILSITPENILIFRIDMSQRIPNSSVRVSRRITPGISGTIMAVQRNINKNIVCDIQM